VHYWHCHLGPERAGKNVQYKMKFASDVSNVGCKMHIGNPPVQLLETIALKTRREIKHVS
jgi:hypothetical protein